MADLLRRMNEGKNEYNFTTPDGRKITVRGDSQKDANEKYFEYMGWD